jgi:hypothetical protein
LRPQDGADVDALMAIADRLLAELEQHVCRRRVRANLRTGLDALVWAVPALVLEPVGIAWAM